MSTVHPSLRFSSTRPVEEACALPPNSISPSLERLASRRVAIAIGSEDARTQGIIQRALDCIAHLFLHYFHRNYRETYINILNQRISPSQPLSPQEPDTSAKASSETSLSEASEKNEPLQRSLSKEKLWLNEQRQAQPEAFPPYLDELLDNGHLHLYHHLVEMKELPTRNQRNAAAEQASFASMSQIVLETKDAIVTKVEDAIPQDYQQILFLVGGTGSGKSTTLCCLRGDRMVANRYTYESQNDEDHLIGHAATSCTLLPNIVVVNGYVIVDFPGFDDTHGPFIAMGVEWALKALLNRYNAQLLVIESITNVEGRFAAVANLGARLERLIKNKQDCLLGLTHYSKDSCYTQLKTIEKEQRESIVNPSTEELVLQANIEMLVNLNQPATQPTIDTLRQDLEKKQKERQEKQAQPFPDTEEKQNLRNSLEATENEFLNQTKLKGIIRFDKLDDPSLVPRCFATLSEHRATAQACSQSVTDLGSSCLDVQHRQLIDTLFERKLKTEIEAQREYIRPENMTDLKHRISETSLISVIFSESHPEIGNFLHAPETDLRLAHQYDQKLVKGCLADCIRWAIARLNMALIQQILEKSTIKGAHPLLELQKKSEELRNYVLRLSGAFPEAPEQAAAAWETLRQKSFLGNKQAFTVPYWAIALLNLPENIPYGIPTLHQWERRSKPSDQLDIASIENLVQEIDFVQQTLLKLKRLEDFIQIPMESSSAPQSIPILPI